MSSRPCLLCAAVVLAAGIASTAQAGEPEWIRQFGTLQDDAAAGVAVGPDGRVHVAGYSWGRFFHSEGSQDALVVTFDRDGNELWSRQPSTLERDEAGGIATDAAGNVYLAGYTRGTLVGANKGSQDAFITAFDRDGRPLWSRQPGTTSHEYANAVATDAEGNVYVAGATGGALGGSNQGDNDAFVIKYDRDGHYVWKRQPGTNKADEATRVATDADGNVYVVGQTFGALGGAWKGIHDAFVIKFDRDGRTLWKRQPGTSSYDFANGVATDADGNVYVVGTTYGFLAGPRMGGPGDPFVIKYDRDGHSLWRDQPGTTGGDGAAGVAVDADGNAYVVGYTSGSLPGYVNLGKADAFLIKYGPGGPR